MKTIKLVGLIILGFLLVGCGKSQKQDIESSERSIPTDNSVTEAELRGLDSDWRRFSIKDIKESQENTSGDGMSHGFIADGYLL